jgi:hypothetical protein
MMKSRMRSSFMRYWRLNSPMPALAQPAGPDADVPRLGQHTPVEIARQRGRGAAGQPLLDQQPAQARAVDDDDLANRFGLHAFSCTDPG